jgi:hypothetical protein
MGLSLTDRNAVLPGLSCAPRQVTNDTCLAGWKFGIVIAAILSTGAYPLSGLARIFAVKSPLGISAETGCYTEISPPKKSWAVFIIEYLEKM